MADYEAAGSHFGDCGGELEGGDALGGGREVSRFKGGFLFLWSEGQHESEVRCLRVVIDKISLLVGLPW